MKPAMYIFINKGLGMSAGKMAAQAAHAAVEASLLSNGHGLPMTNERAALWDAWREGLHYAKYVMECRDREHLIDTQTYLEARGFHTVLIIDEGHTEIDPITPTALGVALVDKDDPHTAASFSSFRLYRDEKPQELSGTIPLTWGLTGERIGTVERIEPKPGSLEFSATLDADSDGAHRARRVIDADSERLGPPFFDGDIVRWSDR